MSLSQDGVQKSILVLTVLKLAFCYCRNLIPCNQPSEGLKDKECDILSARGCCTPLDADIYGDDVMEV
jgi:hypothetical protein